MWHLNSQEYNVFYTEKQILESQYIHLYDSGLLITW